MQAEDGIGCADVTGVQTCALPISAKGCVRVTVHAGEPGASIPPVRARIEAGWGARAYDHAGMTEVGAYGYECAEQEVGRTSCWGRAEISGGCVCIKQK